MQRMAPGARMRTMLRIGAPLLLIGLLAGCMLPPEPKTEAGQDVFNLYLLVLALAAIVFVGVEGFLIYAIFRYRRKPGDDVLPAQLHGNNTVEIIWTAIPTVIVFILFTFSMITLGEVEARSEEPGVTIEVDGFQWQWTFRYENGATETGSLGDPAELALPVGEPVRLVLSSLDVNHAFYVPDFLIKRDVIDFGGQRQDNVIEFTVTEAGTYAGQCAEFCGEFHADMNLVVKAMDRAEFDAYLEALAAGETPPPDTGECGTTVQLTAANIQFDQDSLRVPAGEDFCIELINEDSQPHDVGILDTEHSNLEDVAPGETITYVIPAMDAGEYTFICTIHPSMSGTLTVGE